MSSELRVKKLRGSGGYVMASVSDDQQRKGNLGGPDLFLAPIGRLDNEKISKYFCNTCERDYEGAPRIEFENPNEEVAENLILVEKGQYLCSTCGSAIAEYREFKKPDEAIDVGNAKPIEETFYANEPKPSQFAPKTSMQTPAPEMGAGISDFGFVQPESSKQYVTNPQSPSSVSSIVGMAVFDENAKKVGTAKQIGIDSSQSLVLVITKGDGSEATIPWNHIKKVGEIILVGSSTQTQMQSIPSGQAQVSPQSVMAPKTESGQCNTCGFSNKPGSKFCEECGSKL